MIRQRVAIAVALLLAGCAQPTVSELVLGRVNGEVITVHKLERSFASSHKGHTVFLAGKGAVREVLNTTVDRELLIQEAYRIGAAEQPEIIKARATLRARKAGDGYYEAEVTRKVTVSPAEIDAVYARLGDRFNARHIQVASREEAERAAERVKAGEEFGEVARQVSRSDTATRGGDLGVVVWGRLDPQIEEALWRLNKDEMSKPFPTDDGWNLLYVTERLSAPLPEREAVEGYIKAQLVQRKTRQRSAAVFHDLMERSGSTIDEGPLVAFIVATREERPSPATVVAHAGDEQVTLERVLRFVNVVEVKQLPPDRLRRRAREVVEAEVFRILVEREGLAQGYGERPEVVRELDEFTDEAALEYLLGKVVLADVTITDADAEAYYRDHAKQFTEPESLRLSAIMTDDADAAAEIERAARGGEDFRELARTRSKDPALAGSGGVIPGWITKGKLDRSVEKVAFDLKEGEIGVARGRAGYFVVRLDKRQPEQVTPFDEAKERAREMARHQRSRELVKAWVAKLREASTIEVDDAAIDRAIAWYDEAAHEKEAAREQKEADRKKAAARAKKAGTTETTTQPWPADP